MTMGDAGVRDCINPYPEYIPLRRDHPDLHMVDPPLPVHGGAGGECLLIVGTPPAPVRYGLPLPENSIRLERSVFKKE